MGKLELQQMVLGPVYTNCYFLKNKETGETLIVDPADSPKRIFQKVEDMGAKPVGILLTHGHFDHIMGVKTVQDMTGAKIYMHELEKDFATDSRLNLSTVIAERQCDAFVPDVLYHDGDKIQVGNLTFRVLHTPGHTIGSSCLIVKDTIFSGDTIFKGSIGRTDFPTSDPAKMMESVQKVAELEGNYAVFPAHGDSTTLDYERNTNPFMKGNTDDFGY